jgi:predicted exporter
MTRGDRAAVTLWLAALLFCAYWLLRHLTITADLSAFLPAAATRSQALLVKQLREGVASRLILIGIDGTDGAALAKASADLAQRLRGNALFATVGNGDPALFAAEGARVGEWRYVMSPGVTAERFTAAGLRDALNTDLELLASPLGAAIKGTLPADPTGELRRLAVAFLGQGAPTSMRGVWFSPDGKRALLMAQTKAPGFDAEAQQQAVNAVRDAFAAVGPANARLLLAGPGLFAAEARRVIARDAGRASLVTSLAVLALLFANYRSLWPTAMSALPAMTGLLVGIAAVAWWFGPVHAITLGFGALLIGEAVDYPTYLFANAAPGEPLGETMARIAPTFRLAVLTTAFGALAMLLSSFRGLAQLGLFTMTGVGAAGLVTQYVLPALMPARVFERKTTRLPFDANRGLAFFRRYAWTLAVLLGAAIAVILMHRQALWDDDLGNLNPVAESTKALDRELRAQLGAPDVRYAILVEDADREALLRKSERLDEDLQAAVDRKWLAGFDIASRYLPSQQVQTARRAALPPTAVLAANLAAATAGLPFRDDLFTPFLAAVERARGAPPLDREAFRDTAIGLKLDSLLFESDGAWVAVVPLTGVREPAALDKLVQASGTSAHWLDLKDEAGELVAGYRAQSLRSISVGVACIAVLLYVGLRSVALVLRAAAPVAAAVIMTTATLLAVGVRLSIFHLVAMLLVIGVSLNYALFFNRERRDEAERDLTLLAVFLAYATTLLAALALAFSVTPVLRAIGITTALGATFAFVASAALSRSR